MTFITPSLDGIDMKKWLILLTVFRTNRPFMRTVGLKHISQVPKAKMAVPRNFPLVITDQSADKLLTSLWKLTIFYNDA